MEQGDNPNLRDLPSETVDSSNSRARQGREDEQVMGAQSAQPAKAKPVAMLNGTYGSLGAMTLDDEVRAPVSFLEEQGERVEPETGRAPKGPAASSLRAAAGRVIATVAAKVQEVIPPSGKTGSASRFLGQEDTGSAGTVGSGYVTAGSEPPRDIRVVTGDQEAGDQGLFSPQQARRLQEMQAEAPLLYAGDVGEEGGGRPVSPSPQLPHSASSSSDQAEVIQAEVRRQMQSYIMVVQAELQQRVAVLVEENQVLRQVAASNEVLGDGQGSQTGRNGWLSGIRRGIMGLVQQAPVKASAVPLAIPEGWAISSNSFVGPPPPPNLTSSATQARQQQSYAASAMPIVPATTQQPSPCGLVPNPSLNAVGDAQVGQRPLGLGLASVPKNRGASFAAGAQGSGAGVGFVAGAQGTGAGASFVAGAQGTGAGASFVAGAQGTGAGVGFVAGAQGTGAGASFVAGAQGTGAGVGFVAGAQDTGAGVGCVAHEQGAGAGAGAAAGAQGVGIGFAQGVQDTGFVSSVDAGHAVGTQGVSAMAPPDAQCDNSREPLGFGGPPRTSLHAGLQSQGPATDPPRNPFEAMLSGIVQLQNVVADMAAGKGGSSSTTAAGHPEVVRPGVTELVKLPAPTLEGALGFSDWLHAVKPSMSDLSDSSGECWDQVLQEARDWYNGQFVPANPITRVRLKVPPSVIDRDPRWSRARHRMEHLIIQSCPDVVKSELSAARISGVMGILCRLHVVYKPGGVAERAEALRQVQHPRPADSSIDAVLRLRTWKRWMTRLSDLGGSSPDTALCVQALEAITGNVLKSMPSLSFRINLVRASLHLDTQPTPVKVGEYYEHLLVELEAVSRVSEVTPVTGGGSKGDASKGVKQVEAKAQAATEGAQVQRDPKGGRPAGAPGTAESPKKLCKWFHEGKGCKRGKECRFAHDWNQIPKPERLERCMSCGGKGHRKDVCPNLSGGVVAKRDDGASSAKAAKADGHAKPKSQDPGLKKVLSEAAGVLREVLSNHTASSDGTGSVDHSSRAQPTSSSDAGGGQAESPIAAAAKIQAQLESLESQILDGGPRIRAVACNQDGPEEQTALLDSGATHAVLDASVVEKSSLVPCTVSLAGDQRQTWHQTPGGSLVAPGCREGGVTQTILPLGCLIEQLGCSVRWSRKAGLQLFHPRLGRLSTSLKSGCPQLGREQAMQLIRELEAHKLQELSGRLRRVQAQLKATKGMCFHDALDSLISSGSYESGVAFSRVVPFLDQVPRHVTNRLVVDLKDLNGWEVLKGLPFNRRTRKRLHSSSAWILHLGSNPVDPLLKQLCQGQGLELVVLDGTCNGLLEPNVWKALSWAAYSGRVAAVVGDSPMRTWNTMQIGDAKYTCLRSEAHPWGVPNLSHSLQAKVEDDTLLGLMPMWLWTLASIAKREGVPFCQTSALQGPLGSNPWLKHVVKPFEIWGNHSEFTVQGVHEGIRQTRPFQVCTNLGFSDSGVKGLPATPKAEGVHLDPSWPVDFRNELSLALFGLATPLQAEEERTAVKVVEAENSFLLTDLSRPSGPVSFKPPTPEVQVVSGSQPEEKEPECPEIVPGEPLSSGGAGEGQHAKDGADAKPSPSSTGAKQGQKAKASGAASRMTEAEREKWRKHIAAHHIPFRKDCLQCVMSGSLGLQHRRVKCPTMYALAFDLAGPFKELGKDDRGGKYKYVLVAGLRVPEAALPSPRKDKVEPRLEAQVLGAQDEARKAEEHDEDAASEASWLRDQLEPKPTVRKVGEEDESSQGEDTPSEVSWVEAPFVDDLPSPEVEEAAAADDESEGECGVGLDVDPWEDSEGYADMTDEKFDEALSELLFSGANKVLRFVVPLKARKGPLILAGLQEVVTECHRLGYPVKTVHTDRAKELMSKATMDWLQSNTIQPSFTQGDDPKSNGLAERLVGWVKARARLHLASSGLGVEQWPSAMAFACAEHRQRMLQSGGRLPRFGQKVIFKSKHPTGKSKRPFLRWEHAVYLCPTPRTEGGHVLLRGASGAYLVAKNVRCVEDMVDPEAEFGDEEVVEVDPPEPGFDHHQGRSPVAPSRRVTGKRAVRSVRLASEAFAEDLLQQQLFTSDHCGRLLQLAFGGVGGGTRREHRGPVGFSVIFGAYSHGGLQGITRASRMYPMVSRYLNEYLRRCSSNELAENEWSSLMVVVADEVAMHRDVRNEPGSLNHVTQLTTRMMWVEGDSPLMDGCEREDAQGRMHKGYLLPLTQATTVFDPKRRHAVLPATNWVIAGYTPLGYQKLSTFKQHQLIELGFRLPSLDRTPAVCKLVGPCPNRLPGFRARPYPPPPGRAAMFVRYARMTGEEWAELCQLEEEEFERRIDRWQRVLGGQDEDPNMNSLSASIPHHLFMQTVFRQRNWERNPEVVVPGASGEPRLLARVMDFADDGPTEESPFPDRMLMFSVHDVIRDVLEMVILRVEARRPPQEERQHEEMPAVLQPPGPPPPEVRAVKYVGSDSSKDAGRPARLPVRLPNPTFIRVAPTQPAPVVNHGASACKAEVATTRDLEGLLSQLQEPLSITHTASQEEVRAHLEKWRPAIEKELGSLKKQGVLVSHHGKEAQEMISNPETSVISLKGVFTAKAPGGPEDGLFKRKCRLVGCGNQATHVDADSLYAAGAPAEVVRVALTEAFCHKWSAFTTDIKSAFTQTPTPPHAARRYILRPPRWLIDLGLAQPGEYYSLGMVLYGFKEAPAWWSDHRDSKLRVAKFDGHHLEQAQSDSSVWKIMHGKDLKGYLATYVDDFLVVSERSVAVGLHQWLLDGAGWETDGLSEASVGHPVRFLGMQLQGHEDGHFSLDQEAYVDELVRAYQLGDTNRSKIVCPKEILMHEADPVPTFDEQTVKQAQKVAGECLWLSQRTRIDIAFATTVLCSKVSKDPHGALTIGKRILYYLHHTKDFKLHLKPEEGAFPLRIFTDASFAPLGNHSYGGHVIEVKGVPVLWKASKQQLIAMSSSEAELIQAVEGCMYAESLLTILADLEIPCKSAELCLDNTAAISFVNGSGGQRTRHLKVRGYKIRQLIQSGWKVSHCPGEFQKADLLTKPLPSVRTRFLCQLLQLRGEEAVQVEACSAVQSVGKSVSSLSTILGLLQVCRCCGVSAEAEADEGGVAIEWPWELAALTMLIVLSTLFLWETACASCKRRNDEEPQVRAVSLEKERRTRRLQGKVSAAIDAVLSESPTGDEAQPPARKGRNKCPERRESATGASDASPPTIVYGGINMHLPAASLPTGLGQPRSSHQALPTEQDPPGPSHSVLPTGLSQPGLSHATPTGLSHQGSSRVNQQGFFYDSAAGGTRPVEHQGSVGQAPVGEPRPVAVFSSSTQTDPVIVLDPSEYVYVSGRGDCVHKNQDCHGLRRAFDVRPKAICQYCLNHSKRVR